MYEILYFKKLAKEFIDMIENEEIDHWEETLDFYFIRLKDDYRLTEENERYIKYEVVDLLSKKGRV